MVAEQLLRDPALFSRVKGVEPAPLELIDEYLTQLGLKRLQRLQGQPCCRGGTTVAEVLPGARRLPKRRVLLRLGCAQRGCSAKPPEARLLGPCRLSLGKSDLLRALQS